MDKDKLQHLIFLRDAIGSPQGLMIMEEACRYMVEVGSRPNSNAEWIKGMAMLIDRLKSVESECRRINEER